MRDKLAAVLTSLSLTTGVLSSLAAQAPGIPVRNAGVKTGITLGLDLGFSRGDIGTGTKTALGIGGTASAGFGPFGASVSATRFDPPGSAGSQTWVGGAGQLQVFGGPLVPLKVAVMGAAAAGPSPDDGSGRPSRMSLGIGAALAIPVPVLSIVPWIAPRLERVSHMGDGVDGTRGAISAGIDLRTLSGFTIRTAYDSRAGWAATDKIPSAVSLGVSFSFP